MGSPGGAGAFKDVILAVVIVGAVLGGLYLYTGVWPPMVVVESGSMMHPANETAYGKFGTIDPGDMVFVKKVGKREDVSPLAEAELRSPGANYGKPGDVLVYFPFNNRKSTPIIHRALAYVDVQGASPTCAQGSGPGDAVVYTVLWEGRERTFGPNGVFLPTMGFGPPNFAADRGYKPCWSGFITKGDNPVSNQYPDQAFGGPVLPNQPVRLEWIEGKAVGELPWFGLIKLALSGQPNYICQSNGVPVFRRDDPACDNGNAVKILQANAPGDLWVMLGVSLAAIAIAPLAYDLYVLRRQKEGGGPGTAPPGGGGPPGFLDQLKQRLGLGRRSDQAAGADPRQAFEAPPQAPAQPPSPPPAPSGDAAKPEARAPAKFERVWKK
jgi:signal peptidase